MLGTFKNAMRAVAREIDLKLKFGKKLRPYHLWTSLVKRKAAPMASTRQSVRHALFKHALSGMPTRETYEVTIPAYGNPLDPYPARVEERVKPIPRSQRRAMARAAAKRHWRTQYTQVAA